jgi:hypothetical protein
VQTGEENHVDPFLLADARFALARALVRRNPKRTKELLDAAMEAYANPRAAPWRLERLQEWRERAEAALTTVRREWAETRSAPGPAAWGLVHLGSGLPERARVPDGEVVESPLRRRVRGDRNAHGIAELAIAGSPG